MILGCDIAPSFVAWWIHALFTRPYVRTTANPVHTTWGRSTVELPPGPTVSVGFSYRRRPHRRLGETTVALPDGDSSVIKARLGPLNTVCFEV